MKRKRKSFSYKDAFQKVYFRLDELDVKLNGIIVEQNKINFLRDVEEEGPPPTSGGIFYKDSNKKWQFAETRQDYKKETDHVDKHKV